MTINQDYCCFVALMEVASFFWLRKRLAEVAKKRYNEQQDDVDKYSKCFCSKILVAYIQELSG
ncbi:hypothetical protein [Flavobacterium succinicans]|uniref:hypothetical protein n=1 Tax=Flavobacterium succinicans TaxID=29536 RepID=UPI0011133E3C|nr:hypothetical protein [Flavobacterium succinicans]